MVETDDGPQKQKDADQNGKEKAKEPASRSFFCFKSLSRKQDKDSSVYKPV